MNALTKAFVVVVTILSVVLVTLVVSFVARVDDYRAQYTQLDQKYRADLESANTTANKVRSLIATKGSDLETALESLSALTAELDRANSDVKTLEAKLAQAGVTVSQSTAALDIAARDNEAKSHSIDQQNKLIQDQIAQIGDLQSQRSDLSQSLIESRSQVRRYTDTVMRLQESNKALEQQLLESQASLKTTLKQVAALTPEGAPEASPASPLPPDGIAIRGAVTKIDQVTDDLTFVQLNVGSRDLVKEGMEFTVYRGDEFVGKLQIASVDTADSVGQLTLGGGVQEGDAVRAGKR